MVPRRNAILVAGSYLLDGCCLLGCDAVHFELRLRGGLARTLLVRDVAGLQFSGLGLMSRRRLVTIFIRHHLKRKKSQLCLASLVAGGRVMVKSSPKGAGARGPRQGASEEAK